MKPDGQNPPESRGPDAYTTLEGECSAALTVRGSRFLGFAAPADSRHAAESFIDRVASRYRDATHCCFGYRLALEGGIEARSSDAGEPAGTAGRPILDALLRRDLVNVVCAVVRYFGGIKLGTGGLARAYGLAAGNTLETARFVTRHRTEAIRAVYDYPDTGKLMSLIEKYGCSVEASGYEEKPVLVIRVRRSIAPQLMQALSDATSGKIRLKMEKS